MNHIARIYGMPHIRIRIGADSYVQTEIIMITIIE